MSCIFRTIGSVASTSQPPIITAIRAGRLDDVAFVRQPRELSDVRVRAAAKVRVEHVGAEVAEPGNGCERVGIHNSRIIVFSQICVTREKTQCRLKMDKYKRSIDNQLNLRRLPTRRACCRCRRRPGRQPACLLRAPPARRSAPTGSEASR